MEEKKNTKLIIISGVVLLSIIGGFLFLRNGKEDKSTDSVLENAQETLDEMQGEESEISFESSITQGESVDITFRFSDYSDVPDDPETLQETKDALIPIEGSASFEIIEIGTTDQADNFHKAGEGKELYYVIYEYSGDENNPNSVTIHPRSLNETGWDPAPQFVLIEDGEDDYSSSSYSDPLLESLGYDPSFSGPDLNETDFWANVWEIDEGTTPQMALKYIDMEGTPHYIEVKE
jgi:hypothetical protein